MKGILYSICMGSLALALTAQGQEMRGAANAGVRARARPNMHATAPANTRAAMSAMRPRGDMPAARFHPRSSVAAQARMRATVNRNDMRMNRVNTLNERNVAVNRSANLRMNLARALNERNMAVNRNASLRNRVSFSQAANMMGV